MKKIYIFAGLFIVSNVVDILLTMVILNAGGVELNPIMSFVIEGGFAKAVALKVGLPVIAAYVLVRKRQTVSLAILATAFVVIAAWNAAWILI